MTEVIIVFILGFGSASILLWPQLRYLRQQNEWLMSLTGHRLGYKQPVTEKRQIETPEPPPKKQIDDDPNLLALQDAARNG